MQTNEGYDDTEQDSRSDRESAPYGCMSNDVHVAYGTIVNEIKEVSRSYKEASMALDVGKIFFEERDVIAYSTSGNRTSDLSAPDSALQDVYQRDL